MAWGLGEGGQGGDGQGKDAIIVKKEMAKGNMRY
jgi:hypothetical protein